MPSTDSHHHVTAKSRRVANGARHEQRRRPGARPPGLQGRAAAEPEHAQCPGPLIRHHGRAVRSLDDNVHHPHQRPGRHRHLGLGPRVAHLAMHRRLTRRDLRRLPHIRRRVLLECYAQYGTLCAPGQLRRWLAHSCRQLDRHLVHQLLGSATHP